MVSARFPAFAPLHSHPLFSHGTAQRGGGREQNGRGRSGQNLVFYDMRDVGTSLVGDYGTMT